MSHINDEWLDSTYTSFKEDLDNELFLSCEVMIKKVHDIDPKFAAEMQKEYDEAKKNYDFAVRQEVDDNSKVDDMRLDADLG